MFTNQTELNTLSTNELKNITSIASSIIQEREKITREERLAKREPIRKRIEDVLHNQFREFDVRWDDDVRYKVDEIIEDDGFLHNNFGHIRIVGDFGQDKKITKANYKQFTKESNEAMKELQKDYAIRAVENKVS